MSITLALLAASALTRATPTGSPGMWIRNMDYPPGALRRGEEGPVEVAIMVSPDGRPGNCTIARSSGSPDLDARTCAIFGRLPRFTPAQDESGARVHDLYKANMNWRLPRKDGQSGTTAAPKAPQADLALTVDKLPGGVSQHIIPVSVRIGPDGHVAHCEVTKNAGSPSQLGTVACAQLTSGYVSDIKPPADAPRGFLQTLRVAFVTQAQ